MSQSAKWRQSTHSEIKRYYEEEFPERIADLPDWITPNTPKQYAVAFRQKYPAQYGERENVPDKNFIRRDTRSDNNRQRYIEDWDDLLDFLQRPAARDPMAIGTNRSLGLIHPDNEAVDQPEPAPAAVYYALDNWEQFWVLAFDIDAKDVAKQAIARNGQSYEDVTDDQVEASGIIEEKPTANTLPPASATGSSDGKGSHMQYQYRYKDIRNALRSAFDLKNWLINTVGFDDVRVFYSGQGAHIYAFKDHPYYKFTHQTRRYLGTYIREKLGIPVDAPVTWDRNRVMRLPYSLHTDVNRVVTEVDSPDFDFRNEPLPEIHTGSSLTGDLP